MRSAEEAKTHIDASDYPERCNSVWWVWWPIEMIQNLRPKPSKITHTFGRRSIFQLHTQGEQFGERGLLPLARRN
jgi:hypothetical protein